MTATRRFRGSDTAAQSAQIVLRDGVLVPEKKAPVHKAGRRTSHGTLMLGLNHRAGVLKFRRASLL